jgi:hypothetical protein
LRRKNKKTAGALGASGLMSALSSESLCTPQRAKHVAVMMMVRAAIVCDIHRDLSKGKNSRLAVNI